MCALFLIKTYNILTQYPYIILIPL